METPGSLLKPAYGLRISSDSVCSAYLHRRFGTLLYKTCVDNQECCCMGGWVILSS